MPGEPPVIVEEIIEVAFRHTSGLLTLMVTAASAYTTTVTIFENGILHPLLLSTTLARYCVVPAAAVGGA
jgi:hypothetical protein